MADDNNDKVDNSDIGVKNPIIKNLIASFNIESEDEKEAARTIPLIRKGIDTVVKPLPDELRKVYILSAVVIPKQIEVSLVRIKECNPSTDQLEM